MGPGEHGFIRRVGLLLRPPVTECRPGRPAPGSSSNTAAGAVFLEESLDPNTETSFNIAEPNVAHILASRPLADKDFKRISEMVYSLCRINLHDGKKALVQARLNKRLRQLGIDTYPEYLELVQSDDTKRELTYMIDTLTTNLTFFFRESDHFDYLRDEVLKKIDPGKDKKLRIWSAGCSSGEEAYTLAMVAREALPDLDRMDALILGTDISTRVLAVAREGSYPEVRFRDTPAPLRNKYFEKDPARPGFCRAKSELARLIRFRKLNLMEPWPMKQPFDVIFCRNVMIYFDKQTQHELVQRYFDALRPGGVFMVGHSESLTGIQHRFRYARPTIYIKP